jgi:hypothetical protein
MRPLLGPRLHGAWDIHLGIETEEEGIPHRLKVLKPDMVLRWRNALRRKTNSREQQGRGGEDPEADHETMMELVEFTGRYGQIAYDRDALEARYREKQEKDAELARELSRVRHESVQDTAVIVSSIGTVYGPSLKNLQKFLMCNDRELRKIGQQMSEAVIVGD